MTATLSSRSHAAEGIAAPSLSHWRVALVFGGALGIATMLVLPYLAATTGHALAANDKGLPSLTPLVVVRIVLLNALAGVAFGVLYWRWRLEHAIVAHFCADLVLHGIVGG